MNNNDLYLYHHGVPGMKWGKRKAVQTSGQGGRTAKKQTAKTTDQQKTQKDTQPENSTSKKGWLVVAGILAAVGTIAAVAWIRKSGGKTVAKGKEVIESKKNLKVKKRHATRLPAKNLVTKPTVDSVTKHQRMFKAMDIMSRIRV